MSELINGYKHNEDTKHKISEAHKGRHHSKETRLKMSKAKIGRVLSEETKKKIGEAHKGKHLSEEHKTKIGIASSNRSKETREKISIALRGKRLSEEHKKKISETNIGKHLFSEETKNKMSERMKGNTFAKGIKLSEKARKKISEKAMGHKRNLGRHHSEETKNKISKAHVGIRPSKETLIKLSNLQKGKPSRNKGKINVKMRGNNNPQWKGGVTPIVENIRRSIKYKQWRQDCFIRDSFTCQKCGQSGGDLEVHHIKPFWKLIEEVRQYLPLLPLYDAAMLYTPLWDIANGITLCKKCHKEIKNG
jgi:hypothetical protein